MSGMRGSAAGFCVSRVVVVEQGREHGRTWVGILQEGGDGKQDLYDGESRRPLVLEDVEADAALLINVDVVCGAIARSERDHTKWEKGAGLTDLGCEPDKRRMERIVVGQAELNVKEPAGVGRVRWALHVAHRTHGQHCG